MPEDQGRSTPPEMAAFAHRGRHLMVPAALTAAALSVLHDQGLAFSLGAACAWLLFGWFATFAAGHDWKACSLCAQPPRALATSSARARLARRHHGRVIRAGEKYLLDLVIAQAVLPKPYMTTWWTKVIAAVVYFLTAMVIATSMVRMHRHPRYRDECHVEWCRAGLDRKPGLSKLRRLHQWTGHYGVWLICVQAPATCVLGLLAEQHHGLATGTFYGIALILTGRVAIAVALHSMEPCLHCARHLPANGGEAADRRMRWLRLFHVTQVWLLAAAFLGWAASWVLAGHVAAKVLVCASAFAVVAWAVLARVHSPVRPWCPWCRDGGGEEADADTPDPAHSAPVPA
ncbi:hypothetical protein ACFCY8_11520 [Streptomyces noursei]|uniref:hypothetical protein n=1 Tax=Streptomyces noursei TaxID=1971 RepID=UPI0035D986F1